MNDNRRLDGTHKNLDRDKQIAAGVDGGTNYTDAQRMIWEKELADGAASHKAKMEAMFPKKAQQVDYSEFAGTSISIPVPIIGLLFIVAAFFCFFSMLGVRGDWTALNLKAGFYPGGAVVSLPESPKGKRGPLLNELDEVVTTENFKYVWDAFNHCENSGCARPSTEALIKYVAPHIKPGHEIDQRFLAHICNLDGLMDGNGLFPSGVRLQLKAIDSGCLITNYAQVAGTLNGEHLNLLADIHNSGREFFLWLAGTIVAGFVGLMLLFKRSKKVG